MSDLDTFQYLDAPHSASKQPSTVRRLSNTAKKFGVGLLGLSSFAVFLSPGSARAAYLYWGSTAVKTASTSVCFDFANDAMRSQNFQNIQRSQSEVTGSHQGVYAAITCVRTAPRATAIVMVVGDDSRSTARVRDELRTKIAGIIRFD